MISIVRNNLLSDMHYRPYCGGKFCAGMPRTKWDKDLEQFVCPTCGWVSKFPADFIKEYKKAWNIK